MRTGPAPGAGRPIVLNQHLEGRCSQVWAGRQVTASPALGGPATSESCRADRGELGHAALHTDARPTNRRCGPCHRSERWRTHAVPRRDEAGRRLPRPPNRQQVFRGIIGGWSRRSDSWLPRVRARFGQVTRQAPVGRFASAMVDPASGDVIEGLARASYLELDFAPAIDGLGTGVCRLSGGRRPDRCGAGREDAGLHVRVDRRRRSGHGWLAGSRPDLAGWRHGVP